MRSKVGVGIPYYLAYNSFPINVPFTCFFNKNYGLKAINLLSLTCKPLTLFWPNSHLTCVFWVKRYYARYTSIIENGLLLF